MVQLNNDEIERLHRFVRQVRSVFESSVVRDRNLDISWQAEWRPGTVEVQAHHAHGDQLEALANRVRVVTLRRGDGIRFEDICSMLDRIVTTQGGRQIIVDALAAWEKAKVGTLGFAVVIDGVRITPYVAFELWFYGFVAHANPEKVAQFDKIAADPLARSVLDLKIVEFLTSALDPLDQIAMVAEHIAKKGREPLYIFRADDDGRMWSISLVDGSAVPTPDFPYENYCMPRPPPVPS